MNSDDADTLPPPSADPRIEIPPPPLTPRDTDLSGIDPAGAAMRDIAARLGTLTEILSVVNTSAVHIATVSHQMSSLGTAFETLSGDMRQLGRRVSDSETRIRALQDDVARLRERVHELERGHGINAE